MVSMKLSYVICKRFRFGSFEFGIYFTNRGVCTRFMSKSIMSEKRKQRALTVEKKLEILDKLSKNQSVKGLVRE